MGLLKFLQYDFSIHQETRTSIDGSSGLDGNRNKPIVCRYVAVLVFSDCCRLSGLTWRDWRNFQTQYVSTMVAFHVNAFPAFHGINVKPSGFLPSPRTKPLGSFVEAISALYCEWKMRSLIWKCRRYLPSLILYERPCKPLASTMAAHGHEWGWHSSRSNLRPTATLTASLSMRRPYEELDRACIESLLWGLCTAKVEPCR